MSFPRLMGPLLRILGINSDAKKIKKRMKMRLVDKTNGAELSYTQPNSSAMRPHFQVITGIPTA